MYDRGNGHHQEIIYTIRNFILDEDRWHKPEEILKKFFEGPSGKNSANARRLRDYMHEIYSDEMFHHIIIFGPQGYRGARDDDEAKAFERKIGGILSEYGDIHEAVKHQRINLDQAQFGFPKGNIHIIDAFIHSEKPGQTSFIFEGAGR